MLPSSNSSLCQLPVFKLCKLSPYAFRIVSTSKILRLINSLIIINYIYSSLLLLLSGGCHGCHCGSLDP